MDKNIWSLVVFSLLTQAGAGIFLVHELCFWLFPLLQQDQTPAHTKKVLFLVLALLLIALAVSFLHLGYPLHFLHAVNHLGRSWLSREVLAFSLFLLVVALFLLSGKTNPGELKYRAWLTTAGVLTGLFLLYSMSRLYMIETIPAWDSWYTPFSFFSSALLLGALAILVSFPMFSQQDASPDNGSGLFPGMRILAGFATIILLAGIVAFLTRSQVFQNHPVLSWLRLAQASGACIMLVLFVIPGILKTGFSFISWWCGISFVLTLTGEITGRVLFFLSFDRP